MAYVSAMPFRSASVLTFLYALGYPIGALAVSALSPMAVLIFRFGLAAAILGSCALLARVSWPTGWRWCTSRSAACWRRAVQFVALYLALEHGAPAVLGAVVVAMNPCVTALLAAMFLGESLTVVAGRWPWCSASVAVLAACASRLMADGGVDAVDAGCWWSRLVGHRRGRRLSAAVLRRRRLPRDGGGAERRVRWCPSRCWRRSSPLHRARPVEGRRRGGRRRAAERDVGHDDYVRAINLHGAATVSMLFCVIPAVAGLLAWMMLGQRPDVGIAVGLAAARWRAGSTPGRQASSVSTIQPATADGSIASMRSITRRGRVAGCPCP